MMQTTKNNLSDLNASSSSLIELQVLGRGFITIATKETGCGYLHKHACEIENRFILILDILVVGEQTDTPWQLPDEIINDFQSTYCFALK